MNADRKVMLGVGGGLVLLCAICACVVGIGGYFYRDELMALLGLAPRQRVARMLPAETELYMFTNPNIQNLPGYQNIKKLYLDDPDIQALLDEVNQEVAEEADITFENDIKPWLGGEIVVAMVDFKAAMEDSGATPTMVIAAQAIDEEAANGFVDKILATAAKNDNPFNDEVYQDITLHVQQSRGAGEILTMAMFDDYVVAANDEALVKEMIDRSLGNVDRSSLVDNDSFQKMTSELPAEAIFASYFEISGIFDTVLEDSAIILPPEQTQDLEAFEAVGMAGTLQSDGLQIDVVVTYDVDKMSDRFKESLRQPASPNRILANIPADALFSYNANDLNNIWQQAKRNFESNPDFSQTLQDFEQEMGINIDEDVFGWMTGEFAFVLLEAAPANEFSPPLGGYILIGTDDVDNARSRVDKMMNIFEEQRLLPEPPETRMISNIEMNVFTDFNNQVQMAYGFHDNYLLLAYLEDAVAAALTAPDGPLTGNKNFSAIQSRLPDSNYGYMYLDLDISRNLLENQLSDFEREDYEKNVRPFLEPIHALAVSASTAGVEKGITKGVFFILITE